MIRLNFFRPELFLSIAVSNRYDLFTILKKYKIIPKTFRRKSVEFCQNKVIYSRTKKLICTYSEGII